MAEIKTATKDFLKAISNSHVTLSFLSREEFVYIWNWNDEHIDTQP